MVGHGRGGQASRVGELLDRHAPRGQQPHDAQARGIGEGLEGSGARRPWPESQDR